VKLFNLERRDENSNKPLNSRQRPQPRIAYIGDINAENSYSPLKSI
jgi:hypothetical protein